MVHANSLPYSPYGAYELKAAYQRNLLFGALCTVMLGILTGIILWILQTPLETIIVPLKPAVVDDGFHPLPPPIIPSGPSGPPQMTTEVQGYLLHAIEGDEQSDIDTTVIISPRDYDYGDVRDSSVGSALFFDTGVTDLLPEPGEFIPLEFLPELISRANLDYPDLAKRAGMSGTVTVQVLLGKNGEPLKAIVGKTSGWQLLDDVALAGAYKNTYKPGIQNGLPVICWISYRVDFSLEREY